MPTTPRGLTYPDSAGHTRLWEHLQTLAGDVEDALNRPVPMCRMAGVADVVSTTGTNMTYDFGVGDIEYDTDAMCDPTNDRIVIKTAGYYVFAGQLLWSSNANGYRSLLIQKNGATYLANDYRLPASGVATAIQLHTEARLMAVNDYVTLRSTQTSGVALTIGMGNSTRPWLAARMVAGPNGEPIRP